MSRLNDSYVASPYATPKLLRKIVLRILGNEIDEGLWRNTRERMGRDHPFIRETSARILYGGRDGRSSREEALLRESFNAGWSVYCMLKEEGIIGEAFDKDIG
jgi:hypothetical protein